MEMESWESLDIDDSDLHPPTRPPLSKPLLPCKRSKPQPQTSLPQTLTPKPHQIPGPAGTVQAAMRRKSHNEQMVRENFSSTQEYLRRAIEEDGANGGQDDEDFKTNSWMCAVGSVGDVRLKSSLAAIKSTQKRGVDRLPQVVAMVKSCSPNGLGDLIVTLKDPTGTIGANIHRKALTETEFGKDISVGSVLILREVVVFSPSPSAHYLNITRKNITQVFSKDSGPPTSNYQHASQVRAAAAASVTGPTKHPANLRLGTVERVTNETVRGYTNYKRSVDLERQANEHNLVTGKRLRTISSNSSQQSVVEVEPSQMQSTPREATTGPSKGAGSQREKIVNSQTVNIASQASSAAETNYKNSNGNDETTRAAEASIPKSQVISRTALPEWTDEQLEELLAASCEDW